MTIPFVDLRIESERLRREISAAIEEAVEDCQFILGHHVPSFEKAFADYCGADECVSVGSGTEALHLTLRALGVGPGDEVITAANTFIATALAISYTGASPVLVDANADDYTIAAELIEEAITARTKVILPVHLYGQPADLPAIMQVAERHGLHVVQDACQAHGSLIDGKPLAGFGTAACYSFYPSKNLGGFGDGGAVVTNNEELADRLRMLRNYGQRSKNDYAMFGFNSRLDTLQAAILEAKLPFLESANERRRAAAARYRELLESCEVVLPAERSGDKHVYHLFVVRHPRRDELMAHLQQAGVQCGIHYPTPIHEIEHFRGARTVPEGAPLSSQLAKQILSLPIYPEITDESLQFVSEAIATFSLVESIF